MLLNRIKNEENKDKMNPIEYFNKLREKFYDKGMQYEFHVLVCPPPMFIGDVTYESYLKIVEEVYMKGWKKINTWIDYQKHK